MDWRAIKFDWNRARAFLVTAEEGSLSAAARALGLTQPTLGRQVEALEAELGVVLFERVGRGLRLTPAGFELVSHARDMAEASSRFSMAAFGQNEAMEGRVSISCSDISAGRVLPPILVEMRQKEPRIQIELIASNTAADLLGREADIAIRNFRPTEPDLVARRIREASARLYASPDYLETLGPVRSLTDLSRAAFISNDPENMMLGYLNKMGFNLSDANFPYCSENYMVMWEMVKAGLGIGILDDRIGDADPGVRRVFPAFPPITFPIWLVAHREIHKNRRLRFVFDHLAEALK